MLTKIKRLLGFMAMWVLRVLPIGLLQAQGCVEHSHWYARSSETVQTDLMQTLRLLRVPGETVVILGAVVLFLFVAGMKTGYSFKQGEDS